MMTRWYAASVAVLASLQMSTALLCAWTNEESTRRLPKGWRAGAARLHRLLGCDATSPSVERLLQAEDFLRNLDHPGLFFRVDIRRGEGEKLGFEVSRKNEYLEVDKVQPAGAVPRWNEAHPARGILVGDRIIAVNGLRGNATLMADELKGSANATLALFRVAQEDRKAIEDKKVQDRIRKALREPAPHGLGAGIREPAGSQVAVLHAKNIDKFIAAQPMSLIMFYANWCGHCQHLAPEFTKAAELVAKMDLPVPVRLAKFDDGDAANKVYGAGSPDKFNFTSYPSFYWVNNGKHEGFYGADGSQEIAAQVAARVKGLDIEAEVKEVLFKIRPMMYRPDVDGEVVLDLEPETFDDLVLKQYPENNRVWIIEFYSDKCPFCKSLKPEIVKASNELKNKLGSKVKLAGVNSRAFGMLAERFGVTSYPWIIAVYAGRKLQDMAGLGGAQSVIDWATAKHKEAWRKEPTWADKLPDWPSTKASAAEEKIADNSTGTWRELLGRRTWFFLHTLAAKYPEEPTEADQLGVKYLLAALGQHYPCPICRTHLREKLMNPKLGPPPTGNRQELTQWFCKLHNMVNTDLNKTRFKCNAFDLDLKYLKSCGECSAKGPTEPQASPAGAQWNILDFLGQVGGRNETCSVAAF